MFFEQRLEKLEQKIDLLLDMMRAPAPLADLHVDIPLPKEPAPVAAHKASDLEAERERIKQALMAIKKAGGKPNELLVKAGVGKLSEVTTPEIVAAIDKLLAG